MNSDNSASFLDIDIDPKTLTIITTYTCNAACEECCFECNPSVKHRLSLREMLQVIEDSIAAYPSIEQIVFTGGECFLLKDDLFKAIEVSTRFGKSTRCVSNGFWGKSPEKADEVAKKAMAAGLSEINFSTGLDHQKWVPLESVINASKSLVKYGIPVLVTIEKDSEDSDCLNQIIENVDIKKMLKNHPNFLLQTNSWMPFFENSVQRGSVNQDDLRKGCSQVFSNCTVTPKKEVASCCGLVLEHISEMRVGTIDNMLCYRNEQKDDFLKLWLRVDGPMRILETVLGDGHHKLAGVVHMCQACAILHNDEEARNRISSLYRDHILAVTHRWKIIKAAEKEIRRLRDEP